MVEDDADVRTLTVALPGDLGYEILEAADDAFLRRREHYRLVAAEIRGGIRIDPADRHNFLTNYE